MKKNDSLFLKGIDIGNRLIFALGYATCMTGRNMSIKTANWFTSRTARLIVKKQLEARANRIKT